MEFEQQLQQNSIRMVSLSLVQELVFVLNLLLHLEENHDLFSREKRSRGQNSRISLDKLPQIISCKVLQDKLSRMKKYICNNLGQFLL